MEVRLTARIKGSVAKHESEQLARRVRRKMAERAEAGQPHGRTAYGWGREQVYGDQGRRLGSKDVLYPEQAEVTRWAAAAVLSGQSLRAIVAELNARGALTLNDKPWLTTLRLILLRERNAGRRFYQGQVVGRGTGRRSWMRTPTPGCRRCSPTQRAAPARVTR